MTQILKITQIFTDFFHLSLKVCALNFILTNLGFRKALIVLSFGSFWINTNAQTTKNFEFIKVDSSFSSLDGVFSALPPDVKFGGISGIEFYNNALYLVSDRAFKTDTTENSYIFKMDSIGQISTAFKFFGVKNVESIRFDNLSQKMFFAFEREDSTGVGFINENNIPINLATFSMKTDSLTTENRGIESLCFDEKHNLWFAFESSLGPSISFFQFPYDATKNSYDYNKKKVFQYPFDARICIKPDQKLSGNVGNGITEILPFDDNKLLVMERCFDDRFITMRLFVASIPSEGNIISKQQVFEFTIKNELLGQNRPLRPDNFEGMTWGKEENNQRILYIISDDNFNPKRQRTLLLTLGKIEIEK
ncbi:esterase-like activity of phytase family protein [Lacihabitans sp. CCS-44]|uniref:esterase-like activity of phytase family protein n=1 Tax=Lacihabitans sp. CCS-44 TaxID=2487331 RepID=UPI0020CC3CCB|nr:esterase-like activity of phytase family protein [Lacihabitans sp. CCS-44]MCP9756646.1 esterase-like activity of phytase family protein [Lacihabitans sp. CCS-44]